MERPSDALVINKQLAWTMLAAIVAAAWYFGQTLSGITGKIEALEAARIQADLADERDAADIARDLADHEARIRPLEASAPAIAQSLADIKAAQREQGNTLQSLYRAVNGADPMPSLPPELNRP